MTKKPMKNNSAKDKTMGDKMSKTQGKKDVKLIKEYVKKK